MGLHCMVYGSILYGIWVYTVWYMGLHCIVYGSTLYGIWIYTVWYQIELITTTRIVKYETGVLGIKGRKRGKAVQARCMNIATP